MIMINFKIKYSFILLSWEGSQRELQVKYLHTLLGVFTWSSSSIFDNVFSNVVSCLGFDFFEQLNFVHPPKTAFIFHLVFFCKTKILNNSMLPTLPCVLVNPMCTMLIFSHFINAAKVLIFLLPAIIHLFTSTSYIFS